MGLPDAVVIGGESWEPERSAEQTRELASNVAF